MSKRISVGIVVGVFGLCGASAVFAQDPCAGQKITKKVDKPNLYIVPATLSYELTLEAETLIDDFLKDVGKSRYIISDDEFSQPRRVLDFVTSLLSLESRMPLMVCSPADLRPVAAAGIEVAPLTHDRWLLRTEPSVGLVLIVGPTSELNVTDDGRSALGKRHYVMKLEEPALRASSPRTDERALPIVACPDRSSHRCRDVP